MTQIPRVLVCVTGLKSCEHLIHVGAEIAREDGAELSVVHVAKMGANFLGSASEAQALEYLFEISKSVQADMLLLRNDDVVNTLAAHARKIGATTVVIGGSVRKNGNHLNHALKNALPEMNVRIVLGED